MHGVGADTAAVLVVTAPPSLVDSPKTVNSLTLSDFVAWRYPATGSGSIGLLKAGSVMTVTLVMKIDRIPGLDCVIQQGADGIYNVAHIALNLPPVSGPGPGTALSDTNPADNTSADIPLTVTTGSTTQDPACGYGYFPPSPVLAVMKFQQVPPATSVLQWNSNVDYKLVVQNISTNLTITKMSLQDITAEGVGTPPFTSEAIAILSGNCAPICSGPTLLGPQQLTAYGLAKTIFTTQLFQPPATTTSLGPGGSESLNIRVNYRLPDCDSYQSIQPKPIYNIARVTGWTQNGTPVSTIVQATATTLMKPPPPCNLQVTKQVIGPPPPRIRFAPAQTVYRVRYRNLDAIPHTVGTLIDTMRLTTGNYATQLNVTSNYVCTPTGGVSGYPPNGTVTVAVVNTSLAQQGVRLIQNTTPVVFPPGSLLTCFVTVTVQKPPSNDPFCATNGVLENTGIMDTSQLYNPNLPWPSSPGSYYATVTRPLPKCFGPVVNKVASPLWTWSGGGPVTFTVTINDPPNFSPIPFRPELVDTIMPPLATTGNAAFGCAGGGCVAAVRGPPPAPPGGGNVMGQSLIRVNALPSGSTTTATYVVDQHAGASISAARRPNLQRDLPGGCAHRSDPSAGLLLEKPVDVQRQRDRARQAVRPGSGDRHDHREEAGDDRYRLHGAVAADDVPDHGIVPKRFVRDPVFDRDARGERAGDDPRHPRRQLVHDDRSRAAGDTDADAAMHASGLVPAGDHAESAEPDNRGHDDDHGQERVRLSGHRDPAADAHRHGPQDGDVDRAVRSAAAVRVPDNRVVPEPDQLVDREHLGRRDDSGQRPHRRQYVFDHRSAAAEHHRSRVQHRRLVAAGDHAEPVHGAQQRHHDHKRPESLRLSEREWWYDLL